MTRFLPQVLVQFQMYCRGVLSCVECFMLQRSDTRINLLFLEEANHRQIMHKINDPDNDSLYVILYRWVDGREYILASSPSIPCRCITHGGDRLVDLPLLTTMDLFNECFRLHWQPLYVTG